MSDELKINSLINFLSSDGVAHVRRNYNVALTVVGDSFVHAVQNIGTSEEEIAQVADLGTPGYMLIINLEPVISSDYVEIGVTTGVYSIKVQPREIAIFRINGSTVYAKASPGAANIEYIIFED